MAKFCTHCGNEVSEDAVVCVNCGCSIEKITESAKKKEKVQISVILGAVGIVFAWLFALIGHITSIIGIVIGIKEYQQNNTITGLTVSIIGEVCSIFSSIIGAAIMSSIFY